MSRNRTPQALRRRGPDRARQIVVTVDILEFPPTLTRAIWVYETYGVGGLWLVEDMTSGAPVALWADAPAPVSTTEARLLRIVLPAARQISALRR